MNKVQVYKRPGHKVKIEQTPLNRDWMENTVDRHAYKCFPVSLINRIGWSVSFLEDIEFIWDGISDTTPDHVTVLKGKDICSTGRANGTISFDTGLHFKTDENISIISIVPPNYFIDGAMPFSSVISTSFFEYTYPVAWKITRANHNILIPAGTPIATLIPVSLGDLSTFELDIYDKKYPEDFFIEQEKRNKKWNEITKSGGFTNFYRDAVDHYGNSIGKHEVKSIKMKINDFTEIKEKQDEE